MEVVVERCAALDVHKRSVTVCVRTPAGGGGRREEVRTFPTFVGDLELMAEWLAGEGVSQVVLESTGSYWKPVYYVLEEGNFELLLVNAAHVKQVPGRKTDVKDASWLCQLLEVGLLRGSFVPDPILRELRDLTRYRKRLIQDRSREGQRLEKLLEDAAIKLGAVASDLLGRSARAMVEALIGGERDPEVLAQLARGRLRGKIPELVRALAGRFTEHHAAMARLHLDHIDYLDQTIATLDQRIEQVMAPFEEARERLATIPGVARQTAEVIVAEIGVDMSVFPTAGHLASWAGLCPGNNQSGGKHYSGRTRKGNRWLQDALTQAAWGAAHSRNNYLSAHFWHLARRIGKKKAAVAVAHTILTITYHLLANQVDYQDLGPDYYLKRVDPQRRTQHLIRQLEALGHQVTLHPAA
ncbi:MAG TPA: IS110 family transposase [Acidimicrobiia bacterium]|nr:IS110 family transposase [Acidimicrobiia bacterium]